MFRIMGLERYLESCQIVNLEDVVDRCFMSCQILNVFKILRVSLLDDMTMQCRALSIYFIYLFLQSCVRYLKLYICFEVVSCYC